MAGTVTVWNVTPATKGVPQNVRIYKKTVMPGCSAMLDAKWVQQFPGALHKAVNNSQLAIGPGLPNWYQTRLEENMAKKLTNKGPAPVVLGESTKGFSPTLLHPGEQTVIPDETAEMLSGELKEKLVVVMEESDVNYPLVPEPPAEEPPAEEPPPPEPPPAAPPEKPPAPPPAPKPAKIRKPAKGGRGIPKKPKK